MRMGSIVKTKETKKFLWCGSETIVEANSIGLVCDVPGEGYAYVEFKEEGGHPACATLFEESEFDVVEY